MAIQSSNYVNLQVYCQTVTITNPSKATVEATLRAGSSDRYTISPTQLVLRPHQSIDIDVRLRILRYAQKQKAVQQGQRDIFHIKVCKSSGEYIACSKELVLAIATRKYILQQSKKTYAVAVFALALLTTLLHAS